MQGWERSFLIKKNDSNDTLAIINSKHLSAMHIQVIDSIYSNKEKIINQELMKIKNLQILQKLCIKNLTSIMRRLEIIFDLTVIQTRSKMIYYLFLIIKIAIQGFRAS